MELVILNPPRVEVVTEDPEETARLRQEIERRLTAHVSDPTISSMPIADTDFPNASANTSTPGPRNP
jgi:hypothetical protein